MIIFTVIELRKKTDRYLAADTVTIRAAALPHTLVLRFGTGIFSDEGVLQNNLERYFF